MTKTTISVEEEHFVALLATKRSMQETDRTLGWDDILAFMHIEMLKNICGMKEKDILKDPDFKYYKENHPKLLGVKE